MATHSTTFVGLDTYTVTSHMVTDLAMRPYEEFRLEKRDHTGAFVGYCAMGSKTFVQNALRQRLDGTINEAWEA